MRLRIQIGRTTIWPRLAWINQWDYEQSMMAPRLYGWGVFVERD